MSFVKRTSIIDHTADATFSTTWAKWRTEPQIQMTSGNKMLIDFSTCGYNSTNTWGGGYLGLVYSTDGGNTWSSRIETGYVISMDQEYAGATSRQYQRYNNQILLTDNLTDTLDIEIWARAYSGTFTMNPSAGTDVGDDALHRFRSIFTFTELKG